MAFWLVLLYVFLSFFRVVDLYPVLAPFRIIYWLGIVTLLVTVFSLPISRERISFRAPQLYLMALFSVVVVLSLFAIGWFGGIFLVLQDFSMTLTAFVLVALNVTTFRRLQILTVVLVFANLLLVGQGVAAYHFGYNVDRMLFQRLDDDDQPVADELPRIRNLGFLNDPNDLAQSFVLVLPFLGLAWRAKRRLRNFALVILPAGCLLYGIYLTRSRGAGVALVLLALFAFRRRLGRIGAVCLSVVLGVGMVAVGFAGGRSFSDVDDSGAGRIEAWASGLMMWRSHPILGVGFRQFTDEHPDLTAHNSFVLCLSELGLAGSLVWIALIVVTFMELNVMADNLAETEGQSDSFRRWASALRLSLVGFLATAFFLSRTYIMTMYMLLAMALGLADIARRSEMEFRFPEAGRWMRRSLAVEAGAFIFVWLCVKIAG